MLARCRLFLVTENCPQQAACTHAPLPAGYDCSNMQLLPSGPCKPCTCDWCVIPGSPPPPPPLPPPPPPPSEAEVLLQLRANWTDPWVSVKWGVGGWELHHPKSGWELLCHTLRWILQPLIQVANCTVTNSGLQLHCSISGWGLHHPKQARHTCECAACSGQPLRWAQHIGPKMWAACFPWHPKQYTVALVTSKPSALTTTIASSRCYCQPSHPIQPIFLLG